MFLFQRTPILRRDPQIKKPDLAADITNTILKESKGTQQSIAIIYLACITFTNMYTHGLYQTAYAEWILWGPTTESAPSPVSNTIYAKNAGLVHTQAYVLTHGHTQTHTPFWQIHLCDLVIGGLNIWHGGSCQTDTTSEVITCIIWPAHPLSLSLSFSIFLNHTILLTHSQTTHRHTHCWSPVSH